MSEAKGNVIESVCGRLGIGAYGSGAVSFIPGRVRDEVRFEDGSRLVRLRGVLRAAGYEGGQVLIGYLEEAASAAAAAVGDPAVSVRLPAVLAERCEDGFTAFEAECDIIFEEGGHGV